MYLDTKKLISWFNQNKRDMPWRHTQDPYAIWVSEIMLQQTRVDTVIPYYLRFLKELPTIQDLANVSEEKLLKLWEGLGYYSRVRNMQYAAKTIIEKFDGKFPKTYEDTLSLKGIGEYSVGAILSRSYNLPYASVDGNVLRVLTRYEANDIDISLNATKKYFKEKIEQLKPSNFGFLNESLMELGATICTPTNPQCEKCPLNDKCQAYHLNKVNDFPVKTKKIKTIECNYTCLFLYTKNELYYFENKENGVLKNLLSPILINETLSLNQVKDYLDSLNIEYTNITSFKDKKHIFSHQTWFMTGYKVELKNTSSLKGNFYSKEQIKHQISIPICFQKFFLELNIE